jgi:hypothetical protein
MPEVSTRRFIITTGVLCLALIVSGVALWFNAFPYEPKAILLSPTTRFAPERCKLVFKPPADQYWLGNIVFCWAGARCAATWTLSHPWWSSLLQNGGLTKCGEASLLSPK